MAAQWIGFHLTDRCQLDCQHCLRDPARGASDLPLPLFERILDEAVANYKIKHVSLTGGEPTLHPQFVAVCDAIVDRGMTWHLVTNGRKLPWLVSVLRERPARKQLLTNVNLSLDGAQESTHDRIRERGSYREVLSAASACVVEGIPFSFIMTLHAINEAELEGVAHLAAELGAKRVQFGAAVPTGTLHDQQLALPLATWRSLQARIGRLRSILKMEVSTAEGFPSDRAFHVCEPFYTEQLHVDVHGRLNLCCMHSGVPDSGEQLDVAGDLAQMPLVDAHANLLDTIHGAQRKRLDDIRHDRLGAWDSMPCNYCLKIFGKPHWAEGGSVGPEATRARWNGAWSVDAQQRRRLPLLTTSAAGSGVPSRPALLALDKERS